jgi:superfamily II DNA or RNA helicase
MATGFGLNARPRVPLREWQVDAKVKCTAQFAEGKKVWVQEAAPGTGKTTFAKEAALDLYEADVIDLIIVLAPFTGIVCGWLESFKGSIYATSGPAFQTDTQVWVSTYAGYKAICSALTERRTNGYLLIVDEYHHAERDCHWGRAVETLSAGAKHVLMLSGTPWRTEGTIALLEDEQNIHRQPYYTADGFVEPDHHHRYAKDLTKLGDDRGTVPVWFEFEGATATDTNTGIVHQLYVPDEDEDDWRNFADKSCKEPLGKFVGIATKQRPLNSSLEGKRMHKTLIAKGLKYLEKSRADIKRLTGKDDVSIMHIACSSINDAASVEAYINNTYPSVKAEKIVSDDPYSVKRIEDIQRACRQCSKDRPDVLVSVGMISEGVDIPAIKVTVYFNKFLTLLYIIQLIARGQRRIRIDGFGYADKMVDQTMSYFLAPAHPFLMWVGKEIEKQINQARQELKQADDSSDKSRQDKPERQLPQYEVESTGKSCHIMRGQVVTDRVQLIGAIDAIIDHPSAADHLATTAWKDYLMSLLVDGKGEAVEEMIKEKCSKMSIDLDSICSPEAVQEEMSYDQLCKSYSDDAHKLVHIIRYKMSPFRDIADDGAAYPKIWGKMNKKAGIGNFSKATLEEKRKWVNLASEWVAMEVGA